MSTRFGNEEGGVPGPATRLAPAATGVPHDQDGQNGQGGQNRHAGGETSFPPDVASHAIHGTASHPAHHSAHEVDRMGNVGNVGNPGSVRSARQTKPGRAFWTVSLVALGVMLVAPYVVYPVFLMHLLCFALFAGAFNLLIGYSGLLSFGHAAFFGGAAYVTGHTMARMGFTPELGIIAGTATGALIGLVMGFLAIRRAGIYFTMVTLALAQMLYFVCLQAPFTGGEDGLQGVPRGRLFGVLDLASDTTMYYLVLAICAAGFALIVRTIHSPFGQVLGAIKENEPRAISLGYDVARYKLLAFVLSAGLAGLAGATKTVVLGFATLADVHWTLSGLVVLMVLVGGLGTLLGPVVGAVLIISLENKLGDLGNWLASATGIEWFNTIGDSVHMVTGLIFIICVLAFRRGIVGELGAWHRGRGRRATGR